MLHELSTFIIDEVETAKKNKTLSAFKEPYVKTHITGFTYDKGITGLSSSHESVIKDMWSLGAGLNAVEDKVKACEPFQMAVKETDKIYNLGDGEAESKVLTFVAKIAHVCLDKINDNDIIDLVSLFISELDNNPKLWRPIIWIDGVWMETDSIKILDHVSLRKPEPTDLECEFPVWMGSYEKEYCRNWPSAILECEYREKSPNSVQKNIDSFIGALRLFKVGSIERLSIQWNDSSILLMSSGRVSQSNLISAQYKYGLMKEDTEPLKDFIAEIEPLVRSEIIDKTIEEADYLSIAYERYCDAILKPAVLENRLATAIMALEALYLSEDELSELTERLSQRVAMALAPFGYKPLQVYNDVRRAYGIRSRYVHGSKIKQKEIENLVEPILEYCRVSIIIFLQIHPEKDKGDEKDKDNEKTKMIKLLSNSLLDDTKKKKYHDKMSDKCPIH